MLPPARSRTHFDVIHRDTERFCTIFELVPPPELSSCVMTLLFWLAIAAPHLKRQRLGDFESWLARILRNDKAIAVAAAIRGTLPVVVWRF